MNIPSRKRLLHPLLRVNGNSSQPNLPVEMVACGEAGAAYTAYDIARPNLLPGLHPNS